MHEPTDSVSIPSSLNHTPSPELSTPSSIFSTPPTNRDHYGRLIADGVRMNGPITPPADVVYSPLELGMVDDASTNVPIQLEMVDRQVDFKEITLMMVNPREYIIPSDMIRWLTSYIGDIGASLLRFNIFTRDHMHRPIEVGTSAIVPAAVLLEPGLANVIDCIGGVISISNVVSPATGSAETSMLTWTPHSDVISRVLDVSYSNH
jgi:hypothetical protein